MFQMKTFCLFIYIVLKYLSISCMDMNVLRRCMLAFGCTVVCACMCVIIECVNDCCHIPGVTCTLKYADIKKAKNRTRLNIHISSPLTRKSLH